MKTLSAVSIAIIFFTFWPPRTMVAVPVKAVDKLQDSIKALKDFADSQYISNTDKIEELKIFALKLIIYKNRKK